VTTTAHEDQFTPAPVEVTQADRDAARKAWREAYDAYMDWYTAKDEATPVRMLAQALARHRTASAPAGEVVAWMYECGQIKHTISKRAFMSFNGIPLKDWTETPLYAHPPAPADLAALRAEIERLTAEVRRLDYSTTHTCWDECPRLPCAQRREIEALTAQLKGCTIMAEGFKAREAELTAQLAEARESERAAMTEVNGLKDALAQVPEFICRKCGRRQDGPTDNEARF
jgi:hypothetical protein